MNERGHPALRVLRGVALTLAGFALPAGGMWLGHHTGMWGLGVTMCVLGGVFLIAGPVLHAANREARAKAGVALLALGMPLLLLSCGMLKDELAFGDLTRYGTTAVCPVVSARAIGDESDATGATTYDYKLACPGGEIELVDDALTAPGTTKEVRYDPAGRTSAVMTGWDYYHHTQKLPMMPWVLAGLVAATALSWALAIVSARPRRQSGPGPVTRPGPP
ncbi:hypothetical protein [Nonomuraea recticatena]|uniref:DUF3592 domain-containing protein n=1 Tax=Nonomuraea recticatena TaxID=46178 RepID=A0ABP6EH52_9ACTN